MAERLAWGWSAEELVIHHPGLTLGQVFSALAYYADHAAEIEGELEAEEAWVKQQRAQTPVPPLVARLRAQKKTVAEGWAMSRS